MSKTMAERVVIEVSLFRETGKWAHTFLVDIPYREHGGYISAPRKLLEEIDVTQKQVVPGVVTGGGHYVVIDCSAHEKYLDSLRALHAVTELTGLKADKDARRYMGDYFLSRLYSPQEIDRIMGREKPREVVVWFQPSDALLKRREESGGCFILPTPVPDLTMTNVNLFGPCYMPLAQALAIKQRSDGYGRGVVHILEEVKSAPCDERR
jgi:hypothetical protein